MTTRRAFITGLMASAVAPAHGNLFETTLPSLRGLPGHGSGVIDNRWPRHIIAMGGAPAKMIRWSAVEDFTNWGPA